MNSLLDVQSLTIKHTNGSDSVLVDNLSFSIGRGEILGCTGFSGSGKSLTALSLMGMTSQLSNITQTGKVVFNGALISDFKFNQWQHLRGNKISIVFQHPDASFNPLISCIQQLRECIAIHQPQLHQNDIDRHLQDLLILTHLDSLQNISHAYPHELSGGQLQRLNIAMAISNKPQLVIADEPTSSLDVDNARSITGLLVELCRQNDCGLLFISHDLPLLESVSDRILFIDKGKKSGEVSTQDFRTGNISTGLKAYKSYMSELTVRKKLPETLPEILRLESVSKRYKSGHKSQDDNTPSDTLKGISLVVRQGEMLGIYGSSGSGKTTIAKIITGLTDADSGELFLHNNQYMSSTLDNNREIRRKIQIVFQDASSSLQPLMRIRNQWEEIIRIYHSKEETEQIIQYWLGFTGLDEGVLNKYPHQLSGGQQQRVALIKPLLVRPDVLIFDESMSALDYYHQHIIIDLIIRMQEETGFAGIFISHDMRLLQRIAHRALELKGGTFVQEVVF